MTPPPKKKLWFLRPNKVFGVKICFRGPSKWKKWFFQKTWDLGFVQNKFWLPQGYLHKCSIQLSCNNLNNHYFLFETWDREKLEFFLFPFLILLILIIWSLCHFENVFLVLKFFPFLNFFSILDYFFMFFTDKLLFSKIFLFLKFSFIIHFI